MGMNTVIRVRSYRSVVPRAFDAITHLQKVQFLG